MRSACRTVENRCEIRIVVVCAGGGENAVEDLGLAAHVELRGRLVEQHDARAQPHGAKARASATRCHCPPERSVPPS